MDRKIQEAISDAVGESGQNPGLARKLERWFDAIATGSEDINNRQSSHLHLELLYDETNADDAVQKRSSLSISLNDLLDDTGEGGSA